MKKLISLTLLILALLLSGCDTKTAAQIRAEGEQYATMKTADQSAKAQDQQLQQNQELHEFAMDQKLSKEQARRQMWTQWQPILTALVQYSLLLGFVWVTVFVSASTKATWIMVAAFSQAFTRFIEIRSGLLPLDPNTRLPRQFVYELPDPQIMKNGLHYSFSAHKNKWTIVDPVAHRVLATLDTDHEGKLSMAGMEINRQAVLEYIVQFNMRKSGDGELANAMGDAAPIVPGKEMAHDLILDAKNVFRAVIEDMKDVE